MRSVELIKSALASHQPLALPTFDRRASAVLIPLMVHDGQLKVILTRRSPDLPVHAGEISFPGGHVEPGETTIEAAFREAQEEIGLPANRCTLLGTIDDFSTVTGFRITPHVVLVEEGTQFYPTADEVAEILLVPWDTFIGPQNDMRLEVFRKGRREHFPLYRHGGNVIWGATARMMADLLDIVLPDARPREQIQAGAVLQRLLAANRILITTHVNPDPDGLCAQMAMEELLLRLGKQVAIINSDPPPAVYPSIGFRSPTLDPRTQPETIAPQWDLLLVLDTSEHKRIGQVASLAHLMTGRVVAVDHHLAGSMDNETILLDSTASSTCELVYSLLQRVGFPFNPRASSALYMGLMYDTNGFRYINNRSLPLKAAAHLVEMGADAMGIQEELFSSVTLGRIKANQITLAHMQLMFDSRFAWTYLTKEECSQHQIDSEDSSDVSAMLLSIAGVQAAAFLRELPESTAASPRFKLSMRSLRGYPIGPLCMSLGGGGHANAAGATVFEAPDTLIARIAPELERILAQPVQQ